MKADSSLPKSSSAVNLSSLLHTARWALKLTWLTDAHLTVGLIVTTLLPSLTPAALALVTRGMVNTLIEALTDGDHDIHSLLPWLALGLGLTIVDAVGEISGTYAAKRLRDELNIAITSRVLTHAADLDVAYFEDPDCQDTMARAQNDIAHHFGRFVTSCLNVVTDAVQIVSLVGVLAAIEPAVILFLLLLALPYLVLRWRLARRRYTSEYTRTTKYRWTRYFVNLLTDRHWVPEAKLLSLAPLVIKRFRSLMSEFRDQDRLWHRQSLVIGVLFVICSTTALYAVLVQVVNQVLAGALTVGDVAIYTGATARLRVTLQAMIASAVAVQESMLYISTLDEFLAARPRIAPAVGLRHSLGNSAIEFKNVSFVYPGSDRNALTDISFCVEPSETVALVGENGAGKTTLAKLLARFYDPTEGVIWLNDTDLREVSPAFWHRQIGFVFQHFGRYEATAAENIAYGNWEQLLQDREQVIEVARLANAHDMIKEMPQGYDTFLGRTFGEYDPSQGQWQQLAVARAFAQPDVSLLILDEPTSNLDARTEYALFCRFQELAAGRTTILISHRFSTVAMADRIFVLDRGRIVERGSHQELLALDGHYASLYRLHTRQMTSGQ